jgi:hypothetical protein
MCDQARHRSVTLSQPSSSELFVGAVAKLLMPGHDRADGCDDPSWLGWFGDAGLCARAGYRGGGRPPLAQSFF